MEQLRAQVAVLSVTGGAAAGVGMENVVADSLTTAGHQVAAFESVKNSEVAIRAQLVGWIEDPDVDMVIIVGDGHNISKALGPLTDEPLPGFADLLRMLAFQEIGASAMLSTAEAARCGTTFVFVLPVGEAAVRAAMDKLILPQLDPDTQPKNLISEMPRFKEEGEFTRVDNEPVEDEGVPLAIVQEKTASGAGLIPRLPARPADKIPDPVPRQKSSTQSRVKSSTNKNVLVTKVEDPTKPIELQKLERQIELSKTTGDTTKPMVELKKLPKLPPGATASAVDELGEATIKKPPPVSAPVNEAITKIAAPPERPVAATPIGRPKTAPPTKISPAPPPPRATPAVPLPVVPAKPKQPALIVEDASEVATIERPKPPPPKPKIATEEIEPLDEVETIERPKPPPPAMIVPTVNVAALDKQAASLSESGTHDLGTEEIEPLDAEAERETLNKLLPAEPPAPEPPKKRPPTQPPPRPSTAPSAAEPVRPRPPTQPSKPIAKPVVEIPLPASASLPEGKFDYTGHELKRSKLPLVLVLLVMVGLGIGGWVLYQGRGSSDPPKDAAVVAGNPPAPEPDAAVVAPPPADAPDEIEMEPFDAAVAKPPRDNRIKPRDPKPADPKPTDPKPTDPKPTDPKPTDPKPTDPKPDDPADPGCDEPTCVNDNYARPCCAKYKPATPGLTPGTGDTLEKPQIRAGIERVKPAISRCGEQHPAKGTVKIAVTVNGDGAVTAADVVEAPDPALGKCVAGFVRKATFAKTVNGGSFSYPFVF